jgi:hypothetical protein
MQHAFRGEVMHHGGATRQSIQDAAGDISLHALRLPIAHDFVRVPDEDCGGREQRPAAPAESPGGSTQASGVFCNTQRGSRASARRPKLPTNGRGCRTSALPLSADALWTELPSPGVQRPGLETEPTSRSRSPYSLTGIPFGLQLASDQSTQRRVSRRPGQSTGGSLAERRRSNR